MSGRQAEAEAHKRQASGPGAIPARKLPTPIRQRANQRAWQGTTRTLQG
jgi:hypothetical protein